MYPRYFQNGLSNVPCIDSEVTTGQRLTKCSGPMRDSVCFRSGLDFGTPFVRKAQDHIDEYGAQHGAERARPKVGEGCVAARDPQLTKFKNCSEE